MAQKPTVFQSCCEFLRCPTSIQDHSGAKKNPTSSHTPCPLILVDTMLDLPPAQAAAAALLAVVATGLFLHYINARRSKSGPFVGRASFIGHRIDHLKPSDSDHNAILFDCQGDGFKSIAIVCWNILCQYGFDAQVSRRRPRFHAS